MFDHESESPLEGEQRPEPRYIPEECPHLKMHGDHMWVDGACADCGLTTQMETRNYRMSRLETN